MLYVIFFVLSLLPWMTGFRNPLKKKRKEIFLKKARIVSKKGNGSVNRTRSLEASQYLYWNRGKKMDRFYVKKKSYDLSEQKNNKTQSWEADRLGFLDWDSLFWNYLFVILMGHGDCCGKGSHISLLVKELVIWRDYLVLTSTLLHSWYDLGWVWHLVYLISLFLFRRASLPLLALASLFCIQWSSPFSSFLLIGSLLLIALHTHWLFAYIAFFWILIYILYLWVVTTYIELKSGFWRSYFLIGYLLFCNWRKLLALSSRSWIIVINFWLLFIWARAYLLNPRA